MLEFDGIQIKKRFEFLKPQQKYLDFFKLTIQAIDGRDMIWPACGISIPTEQFFEDIPDRDLDPYPVDVQHGVFCDIYPGPLHDPVAVIFSFRFI